MLKCSVSYEQEGIPLAYGVDILTDDYFVLSQSMRLTDRQTDRQTDVDSKNSKKERREDMGCIKVYGLSLRP